MPGVPFVVLQYSAMRENIEALKRSQREIAEYRDKLNPAHGYTTERDFWLRKLGALDAAIAALEVVNQ